MILSRVPPLPQDLYCYARNYLAAEKFTDFCEGRGLYEVTGELDAFLEESSVLVVSLQIKRRISSLSFLS